VREQSASPSTFWIDVTKSFEKAIGRKFASVKRKITALEEQWRAKFAIRDAQPGLQGNNNTELARAMRAWIAYRDEEERVRREKEEDEKALAVRRERLHELESERLGLTDICRYETTMVGEEEETGPQGVDTGDRSNPISLEDAVVEEPQQPRPVNNLYRDLEPTDISNDKAKKVDPVAPIIELLRKRQREEREEADIRREEQILLNKRLAMMEEQVQMLGRLITQREQKSQPASQPASQLAPPSRPVVIDLDGDAIESAEAPTRFEADGRARPQPAPQTASQPPPRPPPQTRPAAIDLNGNANESTEVSARPQVDAGALDVSSSTEALAEVAEASTTLEANTGAVNGSNSTETPAEVAEASSNVPMPDVSMPDAPANTTAGLETAAAADADTSDTTGPENAAADTGTSNNAPEQSPGVSMDGSAEGPDETPTRSETAAVGTNESVEAPNANVEYSPNVSVDGTADGLDETAAESRTEVPDDTAETRIESDVDDSPGTTGVPAVAEIEDAPEDASTAQATEYGDDEESIATPISEEE
jgi:hypothetical protein